jgi:hypothetical protein
MFIIIPFSIHHREENVTQSFSFFDTWAAQKKKHFQQFFVAAGTSLASYRPMTGGYTDSQTLLS